MDSRYRETVTLLLDTVPYVFKQKGFAMKGGTAERGVALPQNVVIGLGLCYMHKGDILLLGVCS